MSHDPELVDDSEISPTNHKVLPQTLATGYTHQLINTRVVDRWSHVGLGIARYLMWSNESFEHLRMYNPVALMDFDGRMGGGRMNCRISPSKTDFLSFK